MKISYALCAALLLGSVATAGTATLPAAPGTTMNGPMQPCHFPQLGPTCVSGFTYSVKEQFGNPLTGHLWFICRANVMCPGVLEAGAQGAPASFRFVYRCIAPTPAAPVCAPGFSYGSISVAANIPGCVTPAISCPVKFMPMTYTATVAADKHSARFEYQCYRPG